MALPGPRTDPDLIAIARGDRPADVLLRGGRVVNVFTREVTPAAVAIYGSRIATVGPEGEARQTIDLDGRFVAPGFLDAHMHVESTMLTPAEFARVAVPHGTTGVVLDPHEIANVLGIRGVRYLLDASRGLALNTWFAAPSCVPCSPLETAGAALEQGDLERLFEDDRVIALGEMMNVPGVVGGDAAVLEKVRLGLEERQVDGHCPGHTGRILQAYVATGISSDHECTTADEACEKLAMGMRIFLREGSAAQNLEALIPVVTPANAHRFCFCTDDRHPRDLLEQGHIDHVIRKSIALGLDPATAIAIGTRHTAEHFGLPDAGAVAPGCFADLVVFEDLDAPTPTQTWYHGRLVGEHGRYVGPEETPEPPGPSLRDTVRLADDFGAHVFATPARADVPIRVIGLNPHQLVTNDLHLAPRIEADQYATDVERDILKLGVVERHHRTGNVGVGFVQGFGLQKGALASSVGHDSHNITVVGTNDHDMTRAVLVLAECGGGQAVVCDGETLALLPLPIAGLLSDEPVHVVIDQQRALHEACHAVGCPLEDPFMPLSFLSLTVIPALKLSDRGLVDVHEFKVVPLEA